jgi:hypothetical protein
MSMPQVPGGPAPGQGSSGGTDIVTQLQGIVRQLSTSNANINTLITSVNALTAAVLATFPRITGSFTLAAAASTTVTQTKTAANSVILLIPTDASAATLMGSNKSLYISALTTGASFAVSTASGGNAAGTETFDYIMVNPS